MNKVNTLHPSRIAENIIHIDISNEEELNQAITTIDLDILGDVILSLPSMYAEEVLTIVTIDNLYIALSELETDDKTDLLQILEELDKDKYHQILNKLNNDEKENIEYLKRYQESEAGAFMQTEIFDGFFYQNVNDLKEKLKTRKEDNLLENIHNLFVKDDKGSLVGSIPLDDLFISDYDKTLGAIIEENENKYKPLSVNDKEDIEVAIKMFADYDLSVLPVVGYKNILIGRITADDIHDIIQDSATEQMYNLAGVGENSEYAESFFSTLKNRSSWLLVNLFTAILASIVVSFFADTIEQIVALAILMPIVASMGGNAGTQTLTVLVRQIALSEVKFTNYSEAIKKEFLISLFNGVFFAIITSVVTYFWFDNVTLGLIIGVAMIINLMTAGFFGAYIPIFLKNMKVDPAIGSTVILTTITDVIGFFAFLMLAKTFY
jgi:magnesium transporter